MGSVTTLKTKVKKLSVLSGSAAAMILSVNASVMGASMHTGLGTLPGANGSDTDDINKADQVMESRSTDKIDFDLGYRRTPSFDHSVNRTLAQADPSNASAGLRSVAEWEKLFLAVWDKEHSRTYLPLSQSGNSWEYYDLAYAIDGLTAIFEATGNTQYLDRALLYIDEVIKDAKVSSSLPNSQFKDSYLGWPAFNHPTDKNIQGGEYPLFESYLWRYVTKLLRVMRQNDRIYSDSRYRSAYDKILSFSERNIFDKWKNRSVKNLYRNRTHMASHWAFIAVDLFVVSDNESRRSQYREVFDQINKDLRDQIRPNPSNSSAYFWDSEWGSVSLPGQDVSHGNNLISYLVEAHDNGIEWNKNDMTALSSLLLNVIWKEGDGSYAAYVDGSGSGNGWFNDGFCKLGRYDARIQKRLESHNVGRGMQLYGNGALNAKLLAK